MNESLNHKRVCRTAPAKPGLLITRWYGRLRKPTSSLMCKIPILYSGDYTLDNGRQYNRGVHMGRPTEDAGPPIETRPVSGQRPRYEVNEMATPPDPMSTLLNRQGLYAILGRFGL